MNRMIFTSMAIAAMTFAQAAAPAAAGKALSPEEIAAKRARVQRIRLEHTGGKIARPNMQKGEVVFVNCQKRMPQAWIDEVIGYAADVTHFKIGGRAGAFDLAAPKVEGNATLFVIDDEKMPAILVAPEDRWAFVNVATLAKEKRPAYFQARAKKQLVRVFALLCGASNSQFPLCLTRGIVNEADLDKNLSYALPVDVIQRFKPYMETLGVAPEVLTTYRNACQEGWAPAPTNEYQKAIWDKVHAMPTKPIKIAPETKKVKD